MKAQQKKNLLVITGGIIASALIDRVNFAECMMPNDEVH